MLTRASCAKAVVVANAANRAANNVMRCRYPNCFIVTLLVMDEFNAQQPCLRALIWSASRLKALITNDSWIRLALQPIDFAYRRDDSVTFCDLGNPGNEGLDSAVDSGFAGDTGEFPGRPRTWQLSGVSTSIA